MLIARLAAITAAAAVVASLVGAGVRFAGGAAQTPARSVATNAMLAQAVASVRAGMAATSDTPYLNPPAALTTATPGATGFELPGLALKDRYGVPAVYCAARPGLPPAPALGYRADGTGYPSSDPAVVLIAFLNADPAATPVVDALSNPGAACANLSALTVLSSGAPVTNTATQIDSSRTVALLSYSQLAGGRLRGASPVLDSAVITSTSLTDPGFSASTYRPTAGSVGVYNYYGTPLLVTKNDAGVAGRYSPDSLPSAIVAGHGYEIIGGAPATSVQTCPTDMLPVKATNLISGLQFPAHCVDKFPRATASAVPLKAANASALAAAGGIVPMTAMAAERACKSQGLLLAPAESFQAVAMVAASVNNNWSSGAAGVGRFISSLGQPDHAAGLGLAPDAASDPGTSTLGYSSSLAVSDAVLASGSLAGGYPANYLATSTDASALALKRRHVYLSAVDPTMVVYDLGLLSPTSTKVLSSRLSGLVSYVNTLTSSASAVAGYGLVDLAPPSLVSFAKSFATSSTGWGYATGTNVSARVYKRALVNTYYADDRNAAAPTGTFRCVWFAPGTEPAATY